MAPVKKDRPPLQEHFLRDWREFRKLTQEEAAASLDMSRSHLGKIESGKIPYNQYLIEGATVVYNCVAADLLMHGPLDADVPWRLLDMLRKATPEQRKLALDILELVLKPKT